MNWDAIPGTFHKTPAGFPRGTGSIEYTYDNGSLMLREWYYRGLIYESTWFSPDGSVLVTETFDKLTGGASYYLRQDGTIHTKNIAKYNAVDNTYTVIDEIYYDRAGNPDLIATQPIY